MGAPRGSRAPARGSSPSGLGADAAPPRRPRDRIVPGRAEPPRAAAPERRVSLVHVEARVRLVSAFHLEWSWGVAAGTPDVPYEDASGHVGARGGRADLGDGPSRVVSLPDRPPVGVSRSGPRPPGCRCGLPSQAADGHPALPGGAASSGDVPGLGRGVQSSGVRGPLLGGEGLPRLPALRDSRSRFRARPLQGLWRRAAAPVLLQGERRLPPRATHGGWPRWGPT
jgi:hypothetical protein